MVRQYLLVALSLNTLLRHRGPKICCFVVCPAAQKVVFSEYDIHIYRFFSHKILSLIRVGTNILLSSLIDKKSELLTILEILGQINWKSIFEFPNLSRPRPRKARPTEACAIEPIPRPVWRIC